MDEMILDLIDYGVEDEFDEDEENNEITIYGAPTSFGEIQKHLEAEGFEVTGAEFTYIPNDLKDVTPEERETIDKMVEKLEEFDDVQTVYTQHEARNSCRRRIILRPDRRCFLPARPERAEAHSPGHRPGFCVYFPTRPVRAKALK